MGAFDFLKKLNPLEPIFQAAGAGLNAGSNAAAANRGTKLAGQFDLGTLLANRDQAGITNNLNADNSYTSNQIAREASGVSTRDDAWRKLQSAQHALSPSVMPKVSPYAVAKAPPTEATQQGANALTQEVMARLTGGNAVAPVQRTDTAFKYDPMSTIDPRLLDAGKGEKISGILGSILSAL